MTRRVSQARQGGRAPIWAVCDVAGRTSVGSDDEATEPDVSKEAHGPSPVTSSRPATVSARLGHSSIGTTAEIYAHAIHGSDDEAVRKWEEYQQRNRPRTRSSPPRPAPMDCAYGAQTDPPRADRRAGPRPKPGGGVQSGPAGDRRNTHQPVGGCWLPVARMVIDQMAPQAAPPVRRGPSRIQ